MVLLALHILLCNFVIFPLHFIFIYLVTALAVTSEGFYMFLVFPYAPLVSPFSSKIILLYLLTYLLYLLTYLFTTYLLTLLLSQSPSHLAWTPHSTVSHLLISGNSGLIHHCRSLVCLLFCQFTCLHHSLTWSSPA